MLQGLILSCRDLDQGRDIPFCVLDLGLTEEQRYWLGDHVESIVRPEWDFDFPDRDQKSIAFMAQTARPFLPKYFPEYDVYMWMDADTWLQDWSAVKLHLAVAQTGQLAITPEIHRAYSAMYDYDTAMGMYRSFESVFGGEAARKCGLNPPINSGVFALRKDAPHWAVWAEHLGSALQRTSNFYVEQLALNYTIYALGLPTYYLPAHCNWICCHAPPILNRATGAFVEPLAPFAKIWVVHLTFNVKDNEAEIATTDGGIVRRSFQYDRPGQLVAGD
jgi:hypothetical protein